MGGQILRKAGGVFRGLRFDTCQRPLGLRLHRAERLAIDIEHVVGETEARLHLEFANGDSATGRQIDILEILDEPACGHQIRVDFAAGALLGCFGHSVSW